MQWCLQVRYVDSVKTFSKNSSECFGRWVNEENLRVINQKFTAPITALKTRRHENELSEAQAQQIISRMEGVLEQLPVAIKQADERIIGGRRIANEEKILSIYEDTVNVIVRGKAGANVEFGNKLWLDGKSVTASAHVM